MIEIFKRFYQRYLSNPEVITMLFFILLTFSVIVFLGHMLLPVFASIVIAYLLDWIVTKMERCKIPHVFSVLSVYVLFIGLFIYMLVVLLPILTQQLTAFINEMPNMVARAQALLLELPKRYPDYVSLHQIQSLIAESKTGVAHFGQTLLSATIASIPNVLVLIVYTVLVPLLIYFFLMDRAKILNWFGEFLPHQSGMLRHVWQEVDQQIGNYIRGKVFEILIIWVVSYTTFVILKLQYAMLLSALVGLSVLIPFVGVAVVTIPIVIVGFLQWGFDSQFWTMLIAYTVIMVLDGNVLVPLLFSETVNLHPVAIIVAILIFGGLWGFWGIFFAIPLATLVKAVLNVWMGAEFHTPVEHVDS